MAPDVFSHRTSVLISVKVSRTSWIQRHANFTPYRASTQLQGHGSETRRAIAFQFQLPSRCHFQLSKHLKQDECMYNTSSSSVLWQSPKPAPAGQSEPASTDNSHYKTKITNTITHYTLQNHSKTRGRLVCSVHLY